MIPGRQCKLVHEQDTHHLPKAPATHAFLRAWPAVDVQAMAVRRNMPPSNVPIDGLLLGPLIGKGSYGRVYRARWHDKPVAVKVCSMMRPVLLQ